MKTLVIINFAESLYADAIADLATKEDVILIKNPKSIDDLKEQLERHRGQFDEVFINAHGSMGDITPTLTVTNKAVTIPELVEMINHHNADSVKEIHLASCHVGSHFEQLEHVDFSDKYYSRLVHSLHPGQSLFLHGDEHISTTKEGQSRLMSVVNHDSGPITNSILASSEELKVISRKSNNLRGSSGFTIFDHAPYSEFVSENSGDPITHLRSYLASSIKRANEFEAANGMTYDPTAEEKLAKMTDKDLKKYLNEAFELELIKSPDPMQVMKDWGYLLKSGVVDVRHDKSGSTMLMYSAYHGHVDAVKALLADENVGKKFAAKGEMALILAARNNQFEVVKTLLESDRLDLSHNSKGVNSALKIAKEKGLTQISDLIEDKMLDWQIKEDPQKFLFKLIDQGDVDTLRRVIAKGVNLDGCGEGGQTAMTYAAGSGKIEIVKALVEGGADLNLPNEKGNTPLKSAVMTGDVLMTELLLSYEKTVPNFGQEFSQNLLERAVMKKQGYVVKALLLADKEFDINFRVTDASYSNNYDRSDEQTPLGAAVLKRDTMTAKFLLDDNRIRPELVIRKQESYRTAVPPLVIAARGDEIEMIKLFVEKANEGKVDVNINDGFTTPLMAAVEFGNSRVTQSKNIRSEY